MDKKKPFNYKTKLTNTQYLMNIKVGTLRFNTGFVESESLKLTIGVFFFCKCTDYTVCQSLYT